MKANLNRRGLPVATPAQVIRAECGCATSARTGLFLRKCKDHEPTPERVR